MSEGDQVEAALAEYIRVLGRTARDQAVAEAEAEVGRAWASELAHVQKMTRQALALARTVRRAALRELREQQEAGDPDALGQAQARLERARNRERRSDAAARTVYETVSEELDALVRAAEQRASLAAANRDRLATAGRAVRAAAVPGRGPNAKD